MRGKTDIEHYINLGRKLRKIRKEQDLNQKEVASEIGVTFQQYQKYERGENRIPIKALVTFCELTNSDIKELTSCMVNKELENQYTKDASFIVYSIAKLVYCNKKIKIFLDFDLSKEL